MSKKNRPLCFFFCFFFFHKIDLGRGKLNDDLDTLVNLTSQISTGTVGHANQT